MLYIGTGSGLPSYLVTLVYNNGKETECPFEFWGMNEPGVKKSCWECVRTYNEWCVILHMIYWIHMQNHKTKKTFPKYDYNGGH